MLHHRLASMLIPVLGLGLTGCDRFLGDYTCNGDFRRELALATFDSVTVPEGATCRLESVVVFGNVEVFADGKLELAGSDVFGNLQTQGASVIDLRNSRVRGNVQLLYGAPAATPSALVSNQVDGDLQLEEAAGAVDVRSNRVRGNLQVTKSFLAPGSSIRVQANEVVGDLQVSDNRGTIEVLDNVVAQNLQCVDNVPAVLAEGNLVGGAFECSP